MPAEAPPAVRPWAGGRACQVIGYTQYRNDSWEYSGKAISLLVDYRNAFPVFFERLASMGTNVDEYYEDDFFDAGTPPSQSTCRRASGPLWSKRSGGGAL